MQPAVFESLRRCFGIVPITFHDVVAGDKNLAVLGNAHPDPVNRRSDGVDFDARRRVATDDGSCLGLPVALQQGDPKRQEKPADLWVQGCAA